MTSQPSSDDVIAELQSLLAQAKLQRVKDILKREVDRITAEASHRVAPGNPEPISNAAVPAAAAATVKPVVVKQITTYGYDQDDDEYTLIISENMQNVSKDSVSCEFTPQSFVLSIRIPNEGATGSVTEHRLEVRNLFDQIDTKKSRARAGKKNVIVSLKKANEGLHWEALTKVESSLKEKSKPNYNRKKRDGEADDPNAGLMSLMRDMYEQGDDQMKQTIAKAMYESRNKQGGSMDM